MGREVDHYQTPSGERPAKLFLESLPNKVVGKITWVLDLIEDLERVPSNYFSKMPGTEEIWECRAKFGSNEYRILAFMDGGKVILTHGFVKKSWKIPAGEIARAERSRRDHFQRKGDDKL